MAEPIHYDIYWKTIIQDDIKSFIAFFLPDVFPHVDFNQAPVFMDKELHNLLPEQLKGKREGDNLVKIYLKDGTEKWVIIHIEVQSQRDPDFPFRMFTYYYRIWDKHQKDIIPIAIFSSNIKADASYERAFFGGRISYEYNIFEVKKMKGKEKELEASNNIFATIVLASLYAYQTKTVKKAEKRLLFKNQLFKLLMSKNYSEAAIRSLYSFMNNVLWLPKIYQTSFMQEAKKGNNMKIKLEPTENDRILIHGLSEHFYGTNVEKQAMIIKEKDEALQEKDEALQEKDETLKLLKLQQAKQIRQLYDNQKMTDIEELAAFFEVEVDFIKQTLENR